MIWLGRVVSIPVGIVFFLLVLVSLVLLQVNSTFLNPDFYTEELRKADIYEFVLADLLTSAIDESREIDPPEGIDENPLITSGISTQEIVSSINRALPPEWVQEQVEQSFDQFGRYLTGERDEFAVTIRAGDRVVAVVDEFTFLMRKANAFDLLFEQEVAPRIEEAVDLELPLGVELSGDRLVEAVRTIVPSEWVQEQVEMVLDEVTPYIVGERDTFEINVQLADRVEVALEEIKELLRETDAYELLYDEVVEPQIAEFLGESVQLPLGVTVTDDEVVTALRQVAPVEWVQEQVETLIDDVGPYLTGRSDGFATVVSLVDNKRDAQGIIAELVDRKLAQIVEGIPECTSPAQLSSLASGNFQGLPPCTPPNIPTAQILDLVDFDVAGGVQRLVLGPIPDSISFTEIQLRNALRLAGAGDNLDQLDELRELLRDGKTYTQDDLRAELTKRWDEDGLETLEDIRGFLADGWTYTESDFREDLSDGNTASPEGGALDAMDSGRSILKTARTYRIVVYLPMLLLLVTIGFLGGRGWSGRVRYSAAFLLTSAALIFIVFSPVYGALASQGFQEVRDEALKEVDATAGQFPNTARLATLKAIDTMESVADGSASGIAQRSLILAIVGLLALLGAIFWSQIMGLVRRYWPDKGT